MSELKTYFLGKNNGREFPVYLKPEADTVIAELKAENIRLRKRLFRMCARLGKMGYLAFLNIQAKLTTFGDGEGVAMASMKKNLWRNVERKCRAYADKFKEGK